MFCCVAGLVVVAVLCVFIGVFFWQPSWFIDFFVNPVKNEVYVEIKPFGIEQQFTSTGKFKADDVTWSPRKNYVAFFEDIQESYDKEWALKIINPRTFLTRTIFIGNYHLSHYEWHDDHTVRVYINEGSGVRMYRDMSIFVTEPFVDIDHDPLKFWIGQYNAKYREGGEDWRED